MAFEGWDYNPYGQFLSNLAKNADNDRIKMPMVIGSLIKSAFPLAMGQAFQ